MDLTLFKMKEFFRRYRFLVITATVVMVIAAYYVVCSVMAVNRNIARFDEAYWAQAGESGKTEAVEMNRVPGYRELLKEKGLLSALVKMAGSDSIALFLNLPDSMAQLMIRGVGIRNIPVREMKLTPFFYQAAPEALYQLFSEPLQVTESKSTIDKEPVNVVNAPKDSSVANSLPMVTPDTSHIEPVFFILNTDRNIRFYFYQTEGGFPDNWAAFCFGLSDRWEVAKKALPSIFTFNIPAYVPTVYIGISKADAKVLFRALPPHGLIVMTH